LLSLPVVAFTAFVAGYPYLWPDPIGRTYQLFAYRMREMTLQQGYSPTVAIRSREEAIERLLVTLGEQFSVAGRLGQAVPFLANLPVLLDLLLAVGGIGTLVWLIWRRGLDSPHALAGVVVIGQAAMVIGGLRVGYERYYLPLVFVNAVAIGMLAGVAETVIHILVRRVRSRDVPSSAGVARSA
jgi:hypothetical protein